MKHKTFFTKRCAQSQELEPMLPPSKEITHHERKHVEQEPGKVVEKAHEERERRKHAKEEKVRQ